MGESMSKGALACPGYRPGAGVPLLAYSDTGLFSPAECVSRLAELSSRGGSIPVAKADSLDGIRKSACRILAISQDEACAFFIISSPVFHPLIHPLHAGNLCDSATLYNIFTLKKLRNIYIS